MQVESGWLAEKLAIASEPDFYTTGHQPKENHVSTTMRAKLQINSVEQFQGGNERLKFHGVAAKSYPVDGSDEDNTFAKFSPSVALDITIANPALHGKFKAGDTFYVDFTPA